MVQDMREVNELCYLCYVSDLHSVSLRLKGVWVHINIFPKIYAKGNNFCDFLFASLDEALLKGRSTLKGKNLLL